MGKLGSDPKGKIAKAILASLRATVLRSKFLGNGESVKKKLIKLCET